MSTQLMRKVTQDAFGGPEVLRLVQAERPSPGPAEVLVRVHASGVNPTDWKHRAGGRFLGEPPFTLGWDVSGVVEAVGLGVAVLEPGDEVMGMLPYPGSGGGYADYVVASPRTFVRRPAGLDATSAAALPLVGLTAWQALVDVAAVRPGQRVLVHAAAGGVGHVAVQIARHLGAHVIGTASAPKHDLVRGLGAAEVIDYRSTDFAAQLSDIDVVLDTIGNDYGPRSLATMRRGGTYVSITPANVHPDLAETAEQAGVRTAVMLVERDHATLRELARLVEQGELRIEVAATFPAEQVAEAHALAERGGTTGKIVLTW
ncbi:NADP-dependent oxidoreductase [Ornithinimicrobium cavernae]|uniref:NADP-dependent oxidoreductase n=1 Tax=Ornithinimicrobium cavernae TaxID=2666047 RepID=UPI000D6907FB|nr:NADP-dependent oxidoreductase [Ornithinimicrobium cavernae]